MPFRCCGRSPDQPALFLTKAITKETALRGARMNVKVSCRLIGVLCLGAALAWADSLELKNGSLINGKFVGGTESQITFQVGSTVQKYDVRDVASLKFGLDVAETADSTRP